MAPLQRRPFFSGSWPPLSLLSGHPDPQAAQALTLPKGLFSKLIFMKVSRTECISFQGNVL